MRTIGAFFGLALTGGLVVTGGSTAVADPPIAGAVLVTASHGQPFCTDRGQLLALLHAQIAEAPYAPGAFPSCASVSDGAPVVVIEDLAPGTREMHVVRARAQTFFGPVDGYTWSVGLYPH